MQKVYLLEEVSDVWDESSTVHGIFSSREKAKEAALKYLRATCVNEEQVQKRLEDFKINDYTLDESVYAGQE